MPWFYALGHWVLLEPKQNRHLIHQISKMRILVFLYIAYFMSEMIYQNKYNSDMKKKHKPKKHTRQIYLISQRIQPTKQNMISIQIKTPPPLQCPMGPTTKT